VVRRLAREEGWTVAVGDAPGGGAEFRIHLPTSPSTNPPSQPRPAYGAADFECRSSP
jgi:hypothetical protein